MLSREVQLKSLPDGNVRAENFGVFDKDVASPTKTQVLVGVRRLGLNAGLAHRLGGEGTAYGPGIGVGDVPSSDAVVEVLESGVEGFQPGDLAVGKVPWCTAAVVEADELRKIPGTESNEGLDAHLTVLGHVGFTAYTGLIHVGDVQPEDVVYVSGAAGGVGSCVVQFAKARGATVIGVAGSNDKVALLTDTLGADKAINRHDGPAVDLLRDAAPDGIDLYYDNVGGEQLEAALEVLNFGGRAVICGAVGDGGGPANYRRLIYQELTMKGFAVTSHEDLREQFETEVGGWLREGKVCSLHTVFEGIDRVADAFVSLLTGGSSGRVIVSVPSQPRK
ncbi:NADP-dependent oxidoreductase [Rhodococcus sp. PAMC28707]|uniref:MDR family NADP-dependent oxidoreductase n=1 Tax=unclassified Rhodococcus (in: high G+C Gram-positive bacteria) TaxID=192944 RepID=UPI00109E23F7|nr:MULTISPECIES: NADP-dependent oxidoreductase [unclassified Rhodococcus (in: high G+C Gram-positive bacteria)]QCB52266.1 NADP-dependent oxidoreductase [Rhodococcus sp. PAMC28705]QCB59564.1 NADP-dependent oxidoreductase [Rhodococcus sp. PAMC28707]